MSFFTAFTFILPFAYIICALLKEKHAISFRCFFYIFALFFYSIAAYAQFVTPISRYYTVEDKTFENINLILLCCYIIFDIIYFRRKKTHDENIPTVLPVPEKTRYFLSDKGTLLLFLISIGCCMFVLYANRFNLNNLLFRGGDEYIDREVFWAEAGGVSMVLGPIRTMISVICFFEIVFSKQKFFKILSLLLFLLFIFPACAARFFIALVYVPIIVVLFNILLRNRYLFKCIMIFGIAVVFPFIDIFRSTSRDIKNYEMSFDMFSTLHFDSYTSLAYVFENEIITNGRQLLGVLFFWFPRMFWKDKPVGSGAYVAQTTDVMGENNEFSNISMNFLGEGYINFGILGVFIFIIVLALFSRKMDKLFWQKYNGDYHNLFAPFYLYSLGILTFVLRGDLMSGLAYSISAMVAVTLITIIAKNFLQAEKHENIVADKCDS